jgi:hypothetical protein
LRPPASTQRLRAKIDTDPTPPPSEFWIEDHWTPSLSFGLLRFLLFCLPRGVRRPREFLLA